MTYDLNPNDISILDEVDISYLKEILLNNAGELQVVPYDCLKDVPQAHLSQFCVELGYYSIPTTELIEFLSEEIGDPGKTIEICAGSGVIGKALGVKSTDNFMQLEPKYRQYYESLRQTIVPYGKHVERLDALSAIQKYKPKTVVGAWVTHKYAPNQHWRGGNERGVEEKKLLRKVKKYIAISNEKIHGIKQIMDFPHREIKAPWLLSRSQYSDKNVIYIWES